MIKYIYLFTSILCLFSSRLLAQCSQPQSMNVGKVIFIGNSLLRNNEVGTTVDQDLNNMLNGVDPFFSAESIIKDGWRIDQLYGKITRSSYYNSLYTKLSTGTYDYLVLHEHYSPWINSTLELDTSLKYARKFQEMAQSFGTKTALYITWAEPANRATHQPILNAGYLDLADSMGIGVIPVGPGVTALHTGGLSNSTLYVDPAGHATAELSYLRNLVIYGALTGKDISTIRRPQNLPWVVAHISTADEIRIRDTACSILSKWNSHLLPVNLPVPVAIESAIASKTENVGPHSTVEFISPNGNLMATLINTSSHDYGPTTVSIDHVGNGAMHYSTNTDPSKQIAEKTFAISPTNNHTSGSYTVKFYYTQAELAGWRAASGNSTTDGYLFKCPTSIASGTIANGERCTSPYFEKLNNDDTAVVGSFSSGFSGFGFGSNPVPLPVDLVKFELTSSFSDVELKWSTASELNSATFEIERSLNGKNFIKIGEQKAAGNSNHLIDYTFVDTHFSRSAKQLYYRLKQIDFDGTYYYSKIKSIQRFTEENSNIRLTPQPAFHTLYVTLQDEERNHEFTIFNQNGSVVLQGKVDSSNNSIDISTLMKGTYMFQLHTFKKIKFIKQ